MRKLKSKKARILLSVIALVEVLILAAGITFSWMEGGNRGSINGSEIVISSGSSLTMMQDGSNLNTITVPITTLEETSSSDGRNFFFPLADNTSSNTTEMTFREGTASDQNKKYLSLDFQLIAGDVATKVYLGADTLVRCSNENLASALRMSFSFNDGTDSIVFKPSQMPGVDGGEQYLPITAITDEGTPSTTRTSTVAYGDFRYRGTNESTPIFELNKNETKNITLSVWLEGTAFENVDDDIAQQDLGISISFTTQTDDLAKYNFVDNCHNRTDNPVENFWIANNADNGQYPTMMYIFDTETSRYYAMEKSSDYDNDHTWSVYVPRSITNFYFRRYSIDIDQWWNEWEPSMSDIKTDPNGEHTFVAICGNGTDDGEELAGCYGYWKDQYGTYRIYFENSVKWTDLHCYAWNTDGATNSTGAWPGLHMEPVDNHDNLYYIDLKETENITGIQFNSGDNTTTIYFAKNYGDSTYAYVYNSDESTGKKYAGDWPGTKATYDAATGYYRYTFETTDTGNFKVIVNDGGSNQYPASGQSGYQGDFGTSYLFNENYFEPYNNNYEITDTQFFFNGFACWYENPSESGKWLYTDKDDSLIYPNI